LFKRRLFADPGATVKLVRAVLPKAHIATVYAKPLGRPLVDTFITEVSRDTWNLFYVGSGPHHGKWQTCENRIRRMNEEIAVLQTKPDHDSAAKQGRPAER
jgi:hypothetical protein